MAKIVLVSCGKTKHHSRTTALNLYQGDLFKKSMAYARSLQPDAIYIFSAKHGLLRLDEELEPYELTLNKMGTAQRREWAERVISQLKSGCDVQHDEFTFLTGDVYSRHLTPYLKRYSMPMEGLSFGRQLSWLGRMVNV